MMPSPTAVPVAGPIALARTVTAQRVRDDLLPLVTTAQIGYGSERLPFRKLIAPTGRRRAGAPPPRHRARGRLRAQA